MGCYHVWLGWVALVTYRSILCLKRQWVPYRRVIRHENFCRFGLSLHLIGIREPGTILERILIVRSQLEHWKRVKSWRSGGKEVGWVLNFELLTRLTAETILLLRKADFADAKRGRTLGLDKRSIIVEAFVGHK